MKKLIIISLIGLSFCFSTPFIHAQGDPPHPNGGNDPGGGNNPVGRGAPVGGGLFILLALGGGYGAVRWYKAKRKSLLD